MRTPDATFIAKKNAQANKPVHLFTIHDYDGSSNDLTYTDYDIDVTFDGITYTKFPIAYENVGENTAGQVDQVRVTVGNASRAIEAYLETYDLRGKKVTIYTVFADALNDADAYIQDVFYVDSYVSTETSVVFTLTTKDDVLDATLPGRTYMRNYCQWTFKSTECGYAGGETTCNKTLARCKALSNTVRYGGFPSVPSSRIYAG